MRRRLLLEADEIVYEKLMEGDIVAIHNTIEYVICIISHIYNMNRFVGIIISNLQKTKHYNLADTIIFSKRNILSVVLKNE